MLEINSVEEEMQSTMITEDEHYSEHASFDEPNLNSNTTIHNKAKRKVQFSRPLEYWREFDKETGEFLYELKDIAKMSDAGKLKETCVEKIHETFNANEDEDGQKLDYKQNGAKTQSITDVIQAFQKRQCKKIDTSKQSQEKRRKDVTRIKQNVKLPSPSLHTRQLKNGRLLYNAPTCSKLAVREGEFLLNLRKEPSLIQSYCTYSFSSSLGMLTSFKMSARLPLVCTGRKLYDERLLPTTFSTVQRKYSTIRTTARNDGGLPPVVRKLSTPHIVQLFD